MKNKEKYFDKLIQIIIDGYTLAVDELTDEPRRCDNNISCFSCLFGDGSCISGRKEWLEQEYQEPITPITLTDDEKAILRNIDKKFRLIVRDKNGMLYLCSPSRDLIKRETFWESYGFRFNFSCYEHLFKFIKWEDEEPYNIDELLKQNGVER